MDEVVGAGDLLRDDHAPCVDDELAGFRRVECGEDGVPQWKRRSGSAGSWNLCGSLRTSASLSSFGNAKPITPSSAENAT